MDLSCASCGWINTVKKCNRPSFTVRRNQRCGGFIGFIALVICPALGSGNLAHVNSALLGTPTPLSRQLRWHVPGIIEARGLTADV